MNKKKHKISLLQIIFGVLGVGFLLYPLASKVYVDYENQQKTKTFLQQDLSETEKRKLEEQARVSAETIKNGEFNTVDFVEASSNTETKEDSKPLAVLTIPKINLKEEVFNSIEDKVLQNHIGLLPKTSLPYGGVGTNSVLVGHRGTHTAELFRRLDEIQENDYIFLENPLQKGEVLAYKVTKTEIILPTEGDKIKLEQDKDLITLITCTPYLINSHRIIITAERDLSYKIASDDKELEIKQEVTSMFSIEYVIFIVGALLVAIVTLLYKIFKKKKGDNKN